MDILWIGKGHLNNSYTGVDGGSNIRIPLINELKRRGHDIDWASYALNADMIPSNVSFLDIKPYAESCEKSVEAKRNLNISIDNDIVTHSILSNSYDAIVMEVRPSTMFEEAYLQNKMISTALKSANKVFLYDQDLWAETSIDSAFKPFVTLLKPYVRCSPTFQHQEFFPYFYHKVQLQYMRPQYDVVYIGNRYEREWDFVRFMNQFVSHAKDASVLVSGDWISKAPYVVKEFPSFHWIGSTPHSYTLPLLQLGTCTVHMGRSVMRDYGMTSMRPFEAYMADRLCYVQRYAINDYIYSKQSHCVVNDGADVANLINMSDILIEQHEALKKYSLEFATDTLLSIMESS
jgi:hypothetical protein